MSSMRPSQYAIQQRTDGGPFLRFDNGEARGLSEQELEAIESGEYNENDFRGSAHVYYSDIPLPNNGPGWHLILMVTPDYLTIYPINARSGNAEYGKPKYDNIKSIVITRPVYQEYTYPSNQDELDALLGLLPVGLTKDWRYGLGFHYEYRYIIQALNDLEGVDTLILHGGPGNSDAKIKYGEFYLGVERLEQLKRSLDRLTQRHQRETAADKKLVCYTSLLHKADPALYPPRQRKLPPDLLANLVALGSMAPRLSPKDQKQAAKLAQQSVPSLAKSAPETLYQLKCEIELITLGELIEVYRRMMDSKVTEPRWQKFLSEHPFVLDMAFGYPVKKIADQPYVGGKGFSGRGGQYSDFLMAARATGNLALIEIKHPQHELLGKSYRQTFVPSYELSGAVGQIVSQRSVVQREIFSLSHELNERVHAHAIAAIIIIGQTPADEKRQQAFEQYRSGLKDVLVVTFDELLVRLESIHQALTPKAPPKPVPIPDEDLPF
ncbi:Shedu anti-phage system protein SduA domain-containing protein [Pseudomonas sp. MYb541]|uniref:Shedu anti-phage system protein SduA domain-containing protein n=1 Tax=Pseudomonas sp. MYb541 TaxID=2745402 RepID=UPI0030B09CD5